jgi:hypothetical protein
MMLTRKKIGEHFGETLRLGSKKECDKKTKVSEAIVVVEVVAVGGRRYMRPT